MRTHTVRHFLSVGVGILLWGASAGAFAQDHVPDPATQTAAPSKPMSIKGDFTLVSVGDLITGQPVADTQAVGLQRILKIVREGDVAIGNQESIFFDPKNFTGHGPGSPYILRGAPTLAEGLKAIGIDMVSVANNHSNDWGIAGLRAMTELLDKVGIAHAGDGATLEEARSAKFLKTPKGRVALIATTSTFKPGAMAQDALADIPARPGVSALRLREINIVDAPTMEHLRAAAGKPGQGDLTLQLNTPFGQQIEKIYRVGKKSGFSYEMNTHDHYAILKAIRDGKARSDFAVFTIHAHENADGMDDLAMGEPADFLVRLLHDAVDAGADVVMGGGPHSMRGIEIYKGKPIFYGLAVFLFNGNVVLTQAQRTEHYGAIEKTASDRHNPLAAEFRLPESWNESFVATSKFADGTLKEVRLYPIEHGQEKGGEGTVLASPERARKILQELQDLSAVYGTKIAIENSVGIVRP